MIEITGEDISKLNDGDFRSLIGMLCEAVLSENKVSTSAVTWGGKQEAADGGADVRVNLSTMKFEDGYIPRKNTVFQVKVSNMPKSKILDEMRPEGVLRSIIIDLAEKSGAYIIACNYSSSSDTMLESRTSAMEEALEDCPHKELLHTDFYDSKRIATWVREHPSLIFWVKNKIGSPIHGWKAYDNWSNPNYCLQEEYLIDDHVKLYENMNKAGLNIIDGINEMRKILHEPKSSLRLIGLSGVGKTRLIQALFDRRIGKNSLEPSQVVYTDINYNPEPNPYSFMEQAIALKKRLILIIDNCEPNLHKILTQLCVGTGSMISIVTVEYDVQDDQPEETDVFRLEPSSKELIKKLIKKRYENISDSDINVISNFSGGNFRIAVALANTVKKNDNLSKLNDKELLARLFNQRHNENKKLEHIAEVCSLVYSFDSTTDDGKNNEMLVLSNIANMNIRELYGEIKELEKRNLVQTRNVWKAVLPHAISNLLAENALNQIPLNIIKEAFEQNTNTRLLKSFSKRLSYLHECKEATDIAKSWLATDGIISDISNINEHGVEILKNITPIIPAQVLSNLELVEKNDLPFFSRKNIYYNDYVHILSWIAYDPLLFDRSVKLLCLFALTEKKKENYCSIRDVLHKLFHIFLSETHATPIQRLEVIKELIDSNDENRNDLGIELLNETLETNNFSNYNFDLGAHSRDNGYIPKGIEVNQWYEIFIDYAESTICKQLPISEKVKSIIADNYRGLCSIYNYKGLCSKEMINKMEEITNVILKNGSWREGWIAVKNMIYFDSSEMAPYILDKVNKIEESLRPNGLLDEVRFYVISDNTEYIFSDICDVEQDDNFTGNINKMNNIINNLGKEIASKEVELDIILPELLTSNGSNIFNFGQSLAENSFNHKWIWDKFIEKIKNIDVEKRCYLLITGFLNKIQDINVILYEELLNQAVTSKELSSAFPLILSGMRVSDKDMEKLEYSLECGEAPIDQYISLSFGGTMNQVSDNKFQKFIDKLLLKPGGYISAVTNFHMHLHGLTNKEKLSETLIKTGQKIILLIPFSIDYKKGNRINYEICYIIKKCFRNENNGKTEIVLEKIKSLLNNSYFIGSDYNLIISSFAEVNPIVFLNTFLSEESKLNDKTIKVLNNRYEPNVNVLEHIDDNIIIRWIEENPGLRMKAVAKIMKPFKKNNSEDSKLEWTALAIYVMDNYINPVEILDIFFCNFYPGSWMGHLSKVMEDRLSLLSDLFAHENSGIVVWAKKTYESLNSKIIEMQNEEEKEDNKRYQKFE